MNHTEAQTGYGVLVTRKDGTKEIYKRKGCYPSITNSEKVSNIMLNGARKICFPDTCEIVRIKATWEVVE